VHESGDVVDRLIDHRVSGEGHVLHALDGIRHRSESIECEHLWTRAHDLAHLSVVK
jgi:hypothetical protein